jgi:hypothetical protein
MRELTTELFSANRYQTLYAVAKQRLLTAYLNDDKDRYLEQACRL